MRASYARLGAEVDAGLVRLALREQAAGSQVLDTLALVHNGFAEGLSSWRALVEHVRFLTVPNRA
jgi:hypothetical protein